jgi:hypothetical protein
MRSMYIIISLFTLLALQSANSQILDNELSADVTSYCKYIEEKNKAKSHLLLSPDIIVRVQNSNNNELVQNNLVSGLSKDLSDLSKAKLVRQLIDDECQYYKLTQEAKLQIEFVIPWIQRQALFFKLKQIQAAKNKLNTLLIAIQKKIDHQNDTLHTYYQVDSLIQKLDDVERDIRVDLAIHQTPKIQPIPLDTLLNNVLRIEKKRQLTRDKLQKQYNWSVQLQAGAQQYAHESHNQSVQPYVALFLRYNLGAITSNSRIDKSLNHYMDWKSNQVNGIQKQLIHLTRSIQSVNSAEKQRLKHLQLSYQKYDGLSKKLYTMESIKALHFRQQIIVDRIMMEIEISYVKHIIDLLRKIM